MRVISQEGQKYRDLQYEQCDFSVENDITGSFIFAATVNCPVLEVARYSTPEKAEKAMEMLHDTYMDCNVFFDSIVEGHGGMTTAAYVKNNVFRFPREDEL